MAIKLFMKITNDDVLQLPVNPASVQVTIGSNNQVQNVVGLGDVTIIRNRKQAEYRFDCFFPSSDGLLGFINTRSYISTPLLKGGPEYYISQIESVRNNRTPVRFIVSDLDINVLVTVESFEYVPEAGTKDIRYSMQLREYVEYGAQLATINDDGTITLQKTQSSNISESIVLGSKMSLDNSLIVANGLLYKDEEMGSMSGILSKTTAIVGLTDIMSDDIKYQINSTNGDYMGWIAENAVSEIIKS